MFSHARFALPLVTLLLSFPALAGTAQVTFTAPESYTDASLSPGDGKERARNLAGLERHIAQLAVRLPEGQVLAIEVLDVDLAGRRDPQLSSYDIRVMRGITPPRIALRFTLSANAQVLASGDVTLRDTAYLERSASASDTDPLRYEKRMLTEWFRKTFLHVS